MNKLKMIFLIFPIMLLLQACPLEGRDKTRDEIRMELIRAAQENGSRRMEYAALIIMHRNGGSLSGSDWAQVRRVYDSLDKAQTIK